MKIKIKIKINILLFLLFILGITFLNIFTEDQSLIMAKENRNAIAKPNLTFHKIMLGEFADEYEKYFSDNFLWRDKFINYGKTISKLKGMPNNLGIYLQKGANVVVDQHADAVNLKQNMVGQILVMDDKALEINFWNEKASNKYIEGINYLKEKIDIEVELYFLMPPTQIEFLSNNALNSISYSQSDSIEFITKRLDKDIINVNVYDVLKNKGNEYIYFRSDHHWTALGAYYAYREFMVSSGKIPLALEDFQHVEREGFLGTTYAATLNDKVAQKPDVIDAYIPKTSYRYQKFYLPKIPVESAIIELDMHEDNKYGLFLGGDIPLGKITTDHKDYPKIAIIKDSYANAFIPFLVPHYAEIYFIDPRQYSGSIPQFIKESRIDEVLIINYALINRFEGFGDLLIELTDNKIAW